ncbi:actin cytoskeleton-regulatory complex protein PAN1-like isoform X2 [Ctenocephalides felis]|uniref:actin cytoskeleton-regulatory complex protein PAN1 isoform X2 n=1 Tax=Ctenocephalides felis TaxID=7515 RepID=UPI000E6E18CF|nr:actin cytoskeleton-regulatory complex protein PAN1 isoform X2 [Ctenocephalides felis]XP_026475552.1 actin cytoskeleton-regulatory complex protein PAN1-like isoform X2 [Ctenocephalides felis]
MVQVVMSQRGRKDSFGIFSMGLWTVLFIKLTLFAVISLAVSQDYHEYQSRPPPHRLAQAEAPKPTPVPILKQINRHNEDGSYTYGYEGADGSFKIETKLATGEVKGKYGYVDENGKVRVVEYGANKYGFQPAGEGITVAPPTLVDETTRKDGSINPDYDDGSFYQVTAAPKPQQVSRVSRPPSHAVPQFQEYEPQQYEQPQVVQYRPLPPGARSQAVPSVVYSPQPRPPRPEPVDYSVSNARSQPHYTQIDSSAARPAPHQTLFRAQPAPPSYSVRPEPQVPQVSYASQPAPVRPSPPVRQTPARGVLDQLAKDYALPPGGAPALHDVSFGYY